jgi:Ca-activated chloride channel family protein
MIFDVPIILWAAPLAGFAVWGLALWARGARVARARRWSHDLGRRAGRIGRFGSIALGMAGVLATVALAGPRWGSRTVVTDTKGLSLVIAVDISRSMLAEDAAPSRLARAKREARRLVHDLRGDRVGLIAFAGGSYITSPLTVDPGALQLLIEGLDPDIASKGGTTLARALRQGRDLLLAGEEVADRVLVVFTDGETHDSLPPVLEEAQRLRRAGVRLILIAEGSREPARIPVRDLDGAFVGYQRDPDGNIVETWRRDNVLNAVADAAEGVVVAAEVGDQAGTARGLVESFKRAPLATTTSVHDVSRAWIPLLAAAVVVLVHSVTRRSLALASLALGMSVPSVAWAQGPQNAADEAWKRGGLREAANLYLEQARRGEGGDTVWYNLGTAAMAIGDSGLARRALERAATSLEPEVRFRGLYNLGLLDLRLASADSSGRSERLAIARRRFREALLLRPGDFDTKWNLELTIERSPPRIGGGGGGPSPQGGGGGGGGTPADAPPSGGLTREQAEQILNSIAEEERRTLMELNRRRRQFGERREERDW